MSDEILYLTSTGAIKSVRLSSYPDGMPLVETVSGFRHVERILMRPSSLQTFVAAMFWVDALLERGAKFPELILPFVPGARQDRLGSSTVYGGDYLFTAKSIADMINARLFSRVTILDPHSEVIAGLINRCNVVHSTEASPPAPFAGVISPDAGAEKRASAMAKRFGVRLFHGWKTRDVATGKITGFGVEPLPNGIGRVLVVDDICDGGGTFLGLADALPRQVAADLFVTHGIFSQGTAPLLSRFGTVYTTDSLINAPRDGVTQINICERLLIGEG